MNVLREFSCGFLVLLLSGCAASTGTPENEGGTIGETRSPASLPLKTTDTKAQHCVALAMYWEARGEGRKGMLAVGSVVLNRVDDQRFPNSACEVVQQGGETPPCQFSWWCDGKSDRPTDEASWSVSLELARELMTKELGDPTRGALFFHNKSIRSPWRRTQTADIGNHVFYR